MIKKEQKNALYVITKEYINQKQNLEMAPIVQDLLLYQEDLEIPMVNLKNWVNNAIYGAPHHNTLSTAGIEFFRIWKMI
jgi:hypothetical protein